MSKPIDYNTNQFKLFEYLFKHPKEWLDSTAISKAIGAPADSTSATLGFVREFLVDQGLVQQRDKEGTGAGKQVMFIGLCEKPEEEARLWYGKMLSYRRKKKKGKPAPPVQVPTPTHAPKSGITPVQVDLTTMEAIVRVPLDKLATVLKIIS